MTDLQMSETTSHQRAHIREQMVTAIADFIDPVTGEPVVKEVYTADELHDGPSAGEEIDITFLIREAFTGITYTGVDSIVRAILRGWRPGVCHRTDGFYAIVGNGVEGDLRADIVITDFAPTFYQALGDPLPENMGGLITFDAFENPNSESWRYDPNTTFKSVTGDSDKIEKEFKKLA